jgi:hypothetical protein
MRTVLSLVVLTLTLVKAPDRNLALAPFSRLRRFLDGEFNCG